MKRNQLILLEQSLQTDCDGLVTKLHGLVGNYDEISEKYLELERISIDDYFKQRYVKNLEEQK